MTPNQYKRLRERLGAQVAVAKLLDVAPESLSRREHGRTPILKEAELALRYLAMEHTGLTEGEHRGTRDIEQIRRFLSDVLVRAAQNNVPVTLRMEDVPGGLTLVVTIPEACKEA